MSEAILSGGTVLSMDDAMPHATAIALRDGRVRAVGGDELLALRTDRTEMIDLAGATVCPGFIDAHHHISLAAWYQQGVNLAGCRSRAEVLSRLRSGAERTSDAGWLYSYNYDPRLHPGRPITRHDLDPIAAGRPILVMHFSFHEGIVSSPGLHVAGVDRHTRDPQGGRIVRDRRGEPTGELLETALGPVEGLARSSAAGTGYGPWCEAIERYSQGLLAAGITYVCDPGVDGMLEGYLRRAQREGRLPVPVSMLFISNRGLFQPPADRLDGPATGEDADGLEVGALKLFADGGRRCGVCVGLRESLAGVVNLVGRSARLRRPALLLAASAPERPHIHRDGSVHLGYLHYQPEEMADLCTRAQGQGFQLAVHAACNAGIDMTLRVLEGLPANRQRHRVEHLVSLDGEQTRRLAATGAVGVVQPGFVARMGDEWEAMPAPPRLHSVPLRDLLDVGVMLAGSSDGPIAPYSPLWGMQIAVTRRTEGGLEHQPEQAITPLEALRLWTTGAALAANGEGERGVLRPGARADLVVLGANPLQTPPHLLGDIPVLRTMIAGQTVYATNAAVPPATPPGR